MKPVKRRAHQLRCPLCQQEEEKETTLYCHMVKCMRRAKQPQLQLQLSATKRLIRQEAHKRRTAFPPVLLECQCGECESIIGKYVCLGCSLIMDNFTEFQTHISRLPECNEKCQKWKDKSWKQFESCKMRK